MTLNRRDFLKLAAGSTLAAGIVPGTRLAFGGPAGGAHETLVVVFLRGGCDGLNLVPPISGADRISYEVARPELRIPVSGPAAALPLAHSTTPSGAFGLHPRAVALYELYQDGRLAIICGAGMPAPVTRSHFDAQQTMELGTPGSTGIGTGWLTRHLLSAGLPPEVAIPALSAGAITASSLIASGESITMANGKDFRVDTSAWQWNSNERAPGGATGFRGMVERLPDLWAGSTPLHAAGRQALEAMDVVRGIDFDAAPANGAVYPDSSFGRQLKMIALLRRADVGLRVATIDHGGWDTHNGQGIATNSWDPFGNLVESLSQGLAALHQDLDGSAHGERTTILVMSEFGRRLRQNGSIGTDHGYGNVMFALGAGVNGGQVHGRDVFAGLHDQALFEGEDVMVSVDFRQVLGEALIRRTGNANLGQVFPGYSGYAPLGVFRDAPDIDPIFASGFD